MPSRPEGRLTLRQFLRVVRNNTFATYLDEDIIARRLLWRRSFIINEPDAIRHVLLDNAANYTKSELSRRLLERGLGHGFLASEGETWRRHRRIMAPAFDHRSFMRDGVAKPLQRMDRGVNEPRHETALPTKTFEFLISMPPKSIRSSLESPVVSTSQNATVDYYSKTA